MKQLIADAFPALSIHTLTPLGNGKAGDIFLANGDIVFKVAQESDIAHSSLALEYEVLQAFQGKLEIPIPAPLYFGTLADGRPILGETLLHGEPFSQEMYETLTRAGQEAIFAQMGDIFCQIHRADVPRIPGLTTWTAEQNLADFYEFYTDAVQAALTSDDRAIMEKIVENFRHATEAAPPPQVLCHGDMHFGNFLYDPLIKKLCGLLDFGISAYNDPLNDMRYYWSDNTQIMLRHYGGDVGTRVGDRHLFYCIHNLIEELHGEIAQGSTRAYVHVVQVALRQKRL